MELKYTGGPWAITTHSNDKEKWIYAVSGAENGGDIICCPPDMESSLENWPANAKLIVAAPELLEDLQMAYRLLKSIKGDMFDEWPEAKKITETINKATK